MTEPVLIKASIRKQFQSVMSQGRILLLSARCCSWHPRIYSLVAADWAVNTDLLKGSGHKQLPPKALCTRRQTVPLLWVAK